MAEETPACELEAEFRRTQEELRSTGSAAAQMAFGATYLARMGGTSMTRTEDEQRRWAMRGAIDAGRAALKAVRHTDAPPTSP